MNSSTSRFQLDQSKEKSNLVQSDDHSKLGILKYIFSLFLSNSQQTAVRLSPNGFKAQSLDPDKIVAIDVYLDKSYFYEINIKETDKI